MIDVFVEEQANLNKKEINKVHLLLMEGKAKRDHKVLIGKTDHFKNGYVEIVDVPVFEG